MTQFENFECTFVANCLPLCAWPRKYPRIARVEARTWSGTCHLDLIIYSLLLAFTTFRRMDIWGCRTPRTMPVGNKIPQANVWIRIWIHSMESIGLFEIPSPSGIASLWCSWLWAPCMRQIVTIQMPPSRCVGDWGWDMLIWNEHCGRPDLLTFSHKESRSIWKASAMLFDREKRWSSQSRELTRTGGRQES